MPIKVQMSRMDHKWKVTDKGDADCDVDMEGGERASQRRRIKKKSEKDQRISIRFRQQGQTASTTRQSSLEGHLL